MLIEVFIGQRLEGTFEFEAVPRKAELLQIAGQPSAWRVEDVRHLAVRGAPAQLQIAVQPN